VKTACIVQARMGSKRLPGKVLLPLNGRTVLGEVLTRCQRIAGVDEGICAIPLTKGNDKLADEAANYCKLYNSPWPEDDVLRRYYGAAKLLEADVIVRITWPCPPVSPELCGAVVV